MKIFLKLTMIACLGLMITSCGDDEADIAVTTENLMGEWELVSMDMDMMTSTTIDGETTNIDMEVESTAADYTLTFAEESWTTSGSYSYDYEFNVYGVNQSDELTLTDIDGSGEYQLDGSTITLSGSFVSFEVQGYDTSAAGGEQTAVLSFDGDGNLIVTQDLDTDQSAAGYEVTTSVNTKSIWKKK